MSDDELVAFLRARLDEDEAAAQAALEQSAEEDTRWWFDDAVPETPREFHVARHDPARVLREVVFWQKVLDAYSGSAEGSIVRDAIGFTVTAYAAVYSDHADYRPEWKP